MINKTWTERQLSCECQRVWLQVIKAIRQKADFHSEILVKCAKTCNLVLALAQLSLISGNCAVGRVCKIKQKHDYGRLTLTVDLSSCYSYHVEGCTEEKKRSKAQGLTAHWLCWDFCSTGNQSQKITWSSNFHLLRLCFRKAQCTHAQGTNRSQIVIHMTKWAEWKSGLESSNSYCYLAYAYLCHLLNHPQCWVSPTDVHPLFRL